MDASRLALLALWLHAQGRSSELVRALSAMRDPVALARDPRFRPDGEAWRLATRQLQALEVLRIAMVPLWRLPGWVHAAGAPLALFVRGDVALLRHTAVAVVGARAAQARTRAWAHEVAVTVAGAGTIVISGGARGVDGAAHLGALGHGRTVAYLGVAADQIYPRSHRALFARILEQGGALVSEYPPGYPTPSYCHARRNRFIAAHARVVCVAEASHSSGTLGTALTAARLGRPVLVPPAALGGERAGIEQLLDAGIARVAAGPADVLTALEAAPPVGC